MCSMNNTAGALVPYGMKLAGQSPYLVLGSQNLNLELQRAQLQDYRTRLQLGLRPYPSQVAGLAPLAYHGQLSNPYLHPYFYKDPRARFIHEEPKPNHSYIGLIAMAILSVRDKKLVLSDIYQWILDNYNYFRTRGPGWRNSIRHNLSLNDCFIKSGRSANGKGHYWAIHPANLEDFQKGDFRRRRAQRRVRRHMGLSVPDDDDDDSPTPSPTPSQSNAPINWAIKTEDTGQMEQISKEETESSSRETIVTDTVSRQSDSDTLRMPPLKRAKRLFDMESLLAPDAETDKIPLHKVAIRSSEEISSTGITDPLLQVKEEQGCNYTSNTSCDSDDETLSNETANKEDISEKRNCQSATDFSDRNIGPHVGESLPFKCHSIDGNVITNLPLYISELQRNTDLQRRVSAFRNASQFVWPTFPGYISNYHLMALNAGAQQSTTGIVPGCANMNTESAQRWQQTMTNLFEQSQIKDKSITINDD